MSSVVGTIVGPNTHIRAKGKPQNEILLEILGPRHDARRVVSDSMRPWK